MASYGPQTEPGAFVPQTNIFDVSEIYSTEVSSPAFKELLVRLYHNLNNMAIALNAKDTGIYSQSEFNTGKTFFPDTTTTDSRTSSRPVERPILRKVIDFGALTDAGINKTVAHGITVVPANHVWISIDAVATRPDIGVGLHIPFAGFGADYINLWVTATHINIKPGTDKRPFTKCYVTLEYIR